MVREGGAGDARPSPSAPATLWWPQPTPCYPVSHSPDADVLRSGAGQVEPAGPRGEYVTERRSTTGRHDPAALASSPGCGHRGLDLNLVLLEVAQDAAQLLDRRTLALRGARRTQQGMGAAVHTPVSGAALASSRMSPAPAPSAPRPPPTSPQLRRGGRAWRSAWPPPRGQQSTTRRQPQPGEGSGEPPGLGGPCGRRRTRWPTARGPRCRRHARGGKPGRRTRGRGSPKHGRSPTRPRTPRPRPRAPWCP